MAVTYDATGAGADETSGDEVISWSHACGASATIVLAAIAVGLNSAPDVPENSYTAFTRTATFDGLPMTSLGVRNSDDAMAGFTELFYLMNPPTGTPKTIQITLTGDQTRSIIGSSVSYAGVGSVGLAVTSAGVGAPTISVSSAAGHMVVGTFVYGSSIITPTDTQRYLNNLNTSTAGGNLLIQDQAGEELAIMGAADNGGDWYGVVAVNLVPEEVASQYFAMFD